jgi:DnaJ-class molecular chaperone
MSMINYASREINCKIVYYGPGPGGKTTNLDDGYGKGNHIVEITVDVPKQLSERQRELLKELAAVAGEVVAPPAEESREERRSFFGRKKKNK